MIAPLPLPFTFLTFTYAFKLHTHSRGWERSVSRWNTRPTTCRIRYCTAQLNYTDEHSAALSLTADAVSRRDDCGSSATDCMSKQRSTSSSHVRNSKRVVVCTYTYIITCIGAVDGLVSAHIGVGVAITIGAGAAGADAGAPVAVGSFHSCCCTLYVWIQRKRCNAVKLSSFSCARYPRYLYSTRLDSTRLVLPTLCIALTAQSSKWKK